MQMNWLKQRIRYAFLQGLHMLDWDDLRSFLAIARHGSLSAAARALKVTQTTMGRRLEALHARAGAKLLMRTPAGFVLTPAGERVLANVERMEAEALAVQRAVTGEDVRLEGLVRVTAVEAFAAEIIIPSLTIFSERYPGIALEVDVDTRSLSLSRHEADIAVRLAAFEQHELVVRKAGEMAFGVYAAATYLGRRGTPDLAAGAPGHRAVTLQQTLLGTPEGRWFARLIDKAEPALATNSRSGQLAAARAGLGLACLPCYLAEPHPDLLRLAAPTTEPRREIWIGVHRDMRWAPRIRAVLEHLADTLADAAASLRSKGVR
jgi:DNA-binding transcriptional LysR family regulator